MALSSFNREDATFEYPAVAATAEYCISFWSRVQIPDAVMGQFSQRYESVYRAEMERLAHDPYMEWYSTVEQWSPSEEEKEEKWQKILASKQASSNMPKMDLRDVPVIARAALMFHNAPDGFYQAERDQVLDYEVHLTTGPTTVAEVVERYDTEGIYDSVSTMPPPNQTLDQDMLLQVISELRGSIQSLATQDDFRELVGRQDDLINLQKPVAKLAETQLIEMEHAREDKLLARAAATEAAAAAQVDAMLPKFLRSK